MEIDALPSQDHRANSGLREGDIPHAEVNEAIRFAPKRQVHLLGISFIKDTLRELNKHLKDPFERLRAEGRQTPIPSRTSSWSSTAPTPRTSCRGVATFSSKIHTTSSMRFMMRE
jgi:hypothetical protein